MDLPNYDLNILRENYKVILNSLKHLKESDSELSKVYRIIRPETNEVIYIGCTKNSLYERINCHLNESVDLFNTLKIHGHVRPKGNNSKKMRTIGEMIYNMENFDVEIVGQYENRRDAEIVEKALIFYNFHNKYSHNLFNTHSINKLSTSIRYE